jgi:hypothetical protein
VDEATSAGSAMTREISSERVERSISFEVRTVAMCTPSGLGKACAEAIV